MGQSETSLVRAVEEGTGGKLPANQREWQRCPICGGFGRLWDLPLFPTRTKACHGCGGLGMVVRP